LRERALRKLLTIGTVIGIAIVSAAAQAQTRHHEPSRDEFPYSIMVPEPGTRARPAPKRQEPAARTARPRKAAPGGRRIGSSSPSPLPPPRSIVTPPPPTPRVIEPPPLPRIPSYPTPVPGFGGVPAPPTALNGQTFQDKAIGCIHYGTGAGVPPGQIGAYTGSCVNSR
jgi:hypothetical protein